MIKEYAHMDKSSWERGPWDDEPDKVHWIDEDTDLDCLAVRNHWGAWCGYVGVGKDHPDYMKDYSEIPVTVHGSLTYGESCQEEGNEEDSVCHVPLEGRSDEVYWLGFDCGHFCDFMPGFGHDYPEALKRELEEIESRTGTVRKQIAPGIYQRGEHQEIYRSLDFVKSEVAHLAHQLNERSA